jgi:hypothetical protein
MTTIMNFIGTHAKYDQMGQMIFGVQADGNIQLLADLRGWGAIQNLFMFEGGHIDEKKAEAFQDNLGQWIVDAINEKLEKEKLIK